jgi:hypothetical protein
MNLRRIFAGLRWGGIAVAAFGVLLIVIVPGGSKLGGIVLGGLSAAIVGAILELMFWVIRRVAGNRKPRPLS